VVPTIDHLNRAHRLVAVQCQRLCKQAQRISRYLLGQLRTLAVELRKPILNLMGVRIAVLAGLAHDRLALGLARRQRLDLRLNRLGTLHLPKLGTLKLILLALEGVKLGQERRIFLVRLALVHLIAQLPHPRVDRRCLRLLTGDRCLKPLEFRQQLGVPPRNHPQLLLLLGQKPLCHMQPAL